MTIKLLNNQNKFVNKPLKVRDQNKKMTFKGISAISSATFNYIQNSDVAAPLIIDFCSMIAPRTAIDYTRGEDAGIETLRRELASTANVFILPGAYAFGAGWLVNKLSKYKGTNINLNIGSETAHGFKEAWKAAGGNSKKYAENFLKRIEAPVGEKVVKFSEVASDKQISDLAKRFSAVLKGYKPEKELEKITKDTIKILGAEKGINVLLGGKTIETSMKNLFKDAFALPTKIFKIVQKEKKYTEVVGKELDSVINKMEKLSKKKTVLGFLIALSLGFPIQYINRYLTKKKTGSDAFVGLPGYEKLAKEKANKETKGQKLKNLATKVASTVVMLYVFGWNVAKSHKLKEIGKFFTDRKKLLKAFEFNKGWLPPTNQFKTVVAATLIGRVWASKDKHEIRETNIRDLPTYVSLFILGDFIAAIAAYGLSKGKALNGKLPEAGANLIKKVGHFIKNDVSLKSHTAVDAMVAAKKITVEEAKQLKKSTDIATTLGIVFSSLTLGAACPLLNKYVTNKVVAKELSEAKQDQPKNVDKKTFEENKMIVEKMFGSLNNNNSSPGSLSLLFPNKEQSSSVFKSFSKKNQKLLNS